jgi:5'-3' exonuclease
MGDTSDNVKGVGGIGEVNAKKLLEAFGSVERLLALYQAGKVGNLPTPWLRLVNNEDERLDRYKLNKTIMSLVGAARPGVESRQITKGRFDPDSVREIAEELAFHSILSDFDNWIYPFAKRHT